MRRSSNPMSPMRFWSLGALCVLVVLAGGCGGRSRQGRPALPLAADGSLEDPSARAHYQWLRLHDPESGTVPANIGTLENEFAHKLAASVPENSGPVVSGWKLRGPHFIGGRTKALALDVRDENTILAGGVSAGMWKSSDGGKTWRKTTKPDQLHSVSCVVQNTSSGRQDTWYYGTGEYLGASASGPWGSGALYRGDGIFKSTDGGNSWTQLSSTISGSPESTEGFDYIWGLATFGVDGVYAATSTGLYQSSNGGETWEHVLDYGANYPSTEIAIARGSVAYATIGGDGPANGVYRCTDGVRWSKISTAGWPAKSVRTVIGLVPSNPSTVFFLSLEEEYKVHLYKYTESAGWTDLMNNLPGKGDLTTYGGNMLVIGVKPDDQNAIFIGTTGMYRSLDGGQSFELIGANGGFHVDQHTFVFYPSNPRKMMVGNDGGIFRTPDDTAPVTRHPNTGENTIQWESLNTGYLTTQFYTCGIDHGTPGSEMVAGGMQDNGTAFANSSDPKASWQTLDGGDGGFTCIANGGRYICTSLGATLQVSRFEQIDGQWRMILLMPVDMYMGVWMTPIVLDPFDQRILYMPSRTTLWRNSDVTQIPYVFPPVRTNQNWAQLENVKDNYIATIGMSEGLPRRLYYGVLQSNKLFRLDNPQTGQPNPVPLSTTGLPFGYLGCIAVDPRDSNKVIVAYSNYGIVSIFASQDGGSNWTPVAGNLEESPDGKGSGPSVRWVAILYVQNQPVYFAGTSVGLFSTNKLDGLATTWVQEGDTLIGNIPVDMIDVRQSDGYIAVATHGNGIYTSTVKSPYSRVHRRLRQR
jgi:hypothetical protein